MGPLDQNPWGSGPAAFFPIFGASGWRQLGRNRLARQRWRDQIDELLSMDGLVAQGLTFPYPKARPSADSRHRCR